MTKNGLFTLWVLILLLTVAGSASAFDGKRTGFCLGFGAGSGTITSYEHGVSDHQTRSGFQITLDIGAGISDQVLILFSGHLTLNSTVAPPYDQVAWGEPTVIVRVYFKPTVRSFYIFGGPAFAVGTGLSRYEKEVLGVLALGGAAGGGYQLSRYSKESLALS